MAVPTQKQLHRPFLEIVNGSEEIVTFQQVKNELSQRFLLTEGDLQETVSSGQSRFENRTYWAASYLRRAGLLHSPSRARFLITSEGRDILASDDGDIEIKRLKELIEERQGRIVLEDEGDVSAKTAIDEPSDEIDSTAVPPDEQISVLYRELNDSLSDELYHFILIRT